MKYNWLKHCNTLRRKSRLNKPFLRKFGNECLIDVGKAIAEASNTELHICVELVESGFCRIFRRRMWTQRVITNWIHLDISIRNSICKSYLQL